MGLCLFTGHKITRVREIPLVLSDDVQNIKKTKAAVQLLKNIGAYPDIKRVCSIIYHAIPKILAYAWWNVYNRSANGNLIQPSLTGFSRWVSLLQLD